jgi:hypothetical protein
MIGPRPIEYSRKNFKRHYREKWTARCSKPYCRWKNDISQTEAGANSLYDWHMATEHDPIKEQEKIDSGPLPMPGP